VVTSVTKRNGTVVPYAAATIAAALTRCLREDPVFYEETIAHVVASVIKDIERELTFSFADATSISVEVIQDLVEQHLAHYNFDAARRYIRYRHTHEQARVAAKVIDERVQKLFDADKQYLPTLLQQVQFYDKYTRWDDAKGRRETWAEAVNRTIEFLKRETKAPLSVGEWQELREAMLTQSAFPSLRVFQMAGPALERDNMGAYNCSALGLSSWGAFAELLYVLMQGSGVGFSVERRFIDQLPALAPSSGHIRERVTITDDTEGWCDSVRYLLETMAAGDDVAFDYTLIRPKGARLKTKSGRASGPDPLVRLHTFIRRTLQQARATRGALTSLDAHDIACMCGDIVQVGGVRRAAEISLSDLDDAQMRSAKNGAFWEHAPWRAMANNSAVYITQPSEEGFAVEWDALVASGTGERGIFNRESAIATRPARRDAHPFLTNPCFAPGTLVHTREGHFPIESLVGKTVDVWNGSDWQSVDNFRVTATDQEIIKVTLADGSTMRVTPYHQMILNTGARVDARDLQPGDALAISTAPLSHGNMRVAGAYIRGFMIADGTAFNKRPLLWVYEPKYSCIDRIIASANELPIGPVRTNALTTVEAIQSGSNRKAITGLTVRLSHLWGSAFKARLPKEVFEWNIDAKREFIAGLFDGDGTSMDSTNGFGYQLSSVSRGLLEDVQVLLKSIGVHGTIGIMKQAGTMTGSDGRSYPSQMSHRLSLGQSHSIALSRQVAFSRLESFADRASTYNVKPRFNKVVSMEPDGREREVFCCTVAGNHQFALSNGIDVANCGEIFMRSDGGLCNLSTVIARHDDDSNSLMRKERIAAIFGTLQSLLTKFTYVSDVWRRNAEEERLLGVDVNGQMDCPLLRPGHPGRSALLEALKAHALDVNRIYASRFGVSASVAVTCVKPSGNSSVLFNTSSGLHARYAAYYIRRLRMDASSPLTRLLIESGVPHAPENGQTLDRATVIVFEFPVASPDGAITRHDLDATQQLDNWLEWKRHYTEHNPSVTISVDAHEWAAAGAWVWAHWDEIGGLSFLPKDGGVYRLMPYEEIDKAEYERRAAAMPSVNWAKLTRYEHDDMTTSAREAACVAGGCDL